MLKRALAVAGFSAALAAGRVPGPAAAAVLDSAKQMLSGAGFVAPADLPETTPPPPALPMPVVNLPMAKAAFALARAAPAAPQAPLGAPEEEFILTGIPRRPPDGAMKQVLPGVYHGGLPTLDLGTAYGDNFALAHALNRLSSNEAGKPPSYIELLRGARLVSVRQFLERLAHDGHAISVKEMLYFANFGNLWLKRDGQWLPVATPFLINTGIRLPSGKQLILPGTHAELNIAVRGPLVNSDIVFRFFVGTPCPLFDPPPARKQSWTGGRAARRWEGAAAIAVIERAATVRRDWGLKVLRHELPAGGYGLLGLSNEPIAMVTGDPIYPLIREPWLYQDGMEIDAWANALPVDGPAVPDPRRVYASLPVAEPDAIALLPSREMARELKSMIGK